MKIYRWIRKSDKYHKWYECEQCGGRIVDDSEILKNDLRLPPPICPYCKAHVVLDMFREEEDDGGYHVQ